MDDENAAIERARALALHALAESWPTHQLQAIGEKLLATPDVGQGVAALCAERLRARGWTGDDELADQLTGATPSSWRSLPVELDLLADLIDGGMESRGGYLNLDTGEVLLAEVIEDDVDGEFEGVDEDRWMYVVPEGSRDAYHDMVDFLDEIDDARLVRRLERALEGRGAFRRFRDEISRHDKPYTLWHSFRDDRRMGRARAWLADHDIVATPMQ